MRQNLNIQKICFGLRPIILFILFFNIVARAVEARPAWVSHTPQDTAQTLYFVGRSAKVASEAEGLKAATTDASEQLLRQEFGTSIKVDTTQSETLKNVSYSSQLTEVSDLILLKGFKQSDVYTEHDNDGLIVWALYKVSKADLKDEKARLVALKRKNEANANKPATDHTNATSSEYNNGGQPKLRKGLKKSVVIALFGKPESAKKGSGGWDRDYFSYTTNNFCEFSCMVWFDGSGKVESWSSFRPEYTTDLDDTKSASVPKGKDKTAITPVTSSSLNSLTKTDLKKMLGKGVMSDVLVTDHWFFVVPAGKSSTDYHKRSKSQKIVVHNNEEFGVASRSQSLKPWVNMTLKLTVPSGAENFKCKTCRPGELTILPDGQNVILSKSIGSHKENGSFYWGINKHDPRGKYKLVLLFNGAEIETYSFEVE